MQNLNDLISRQEAIDALMPIYKSASLRNRNVFSTARKCMAAIVELPSAEPEIIRCKNCKRWHKITKNSEYGLCESWTQIETTKSNDFCSRGERKTDG